MDTLALMQTPFIGREQELAEIGALLEDPACRLLTLTGPGGMGKTRLALEVAARQRDSFPDGVFFVPLAPLGRADDILAAIVEATPFRLGQDNRAPREQFFAYLRDKRAKHMLFVLDNFEHLLDGAGIVAEILAAGGCLKILVTSREALNLQEEWLRQVGGLAYPDHANGRAPEDYPAVQLFFDRARRISGAFDLAANSSSVVEICRLVDGMPLAIELAVGWLKTLQPAAIAAEIRANMDILATRARNLPERHRSIRSVFAHSWALLAADEREVFQKLALFRGGFSRAAAEVVAGASLTTLAGLVDKSLLRLRAAGRYEIHELLRQYGAEQLDAARQTAAVERLYSEYYLDLLHQLEPDIKAQEQIAALDIIEADFENVRLAWQLAVQHSNLAALNCAVESLEFVGDRRGRYHDVVPLLRAALEHFPQPHDQQQYVLRRIQARLIRLILLGNMRIEADLGAQIEDCVAFARARQDQAELGFSLMIAGIVAVWESIDEHTYAKARAAAFFRESLAVYEALGDLYYEADVLAWIASVLPAEALELSSTDYFMRSLTLRRAIGDRNGIAWLTLNLTAFAYAEQDYRACERYAREALILMREIRDLKGIMQSSFAVAQTTMLRGGLAEARVLAEQMRDLAEETNNLDGRMMAARLLAFLVCVLDEDYAEGAQQAQRAHELSLEPYFGGHNDVGEHWGRVVAACGLGQYDVARQGYAASFWRSYDEPGPVTICLALEAVARAVEGAPVAAAELLGLAFAQPPWVSGWLEHWPLLTRLREELAQQLGAAFAAAWERGSGNDPAAVISALITPIDASSRLPSNHDLVEPLSERELEVLGLIAAGLSNRDIAERLVLTVGTVKTHTRNIYGKLNVNSRTQALAQASKYNIL